MTINAYNKSQPDAQQAICRLLTEQLDAGIAGATSKLWHGGPVWFLDDNPIAGYSVGSNKKTGTYVRVMFWSGADFQTPGLTMGTGKFKDAHIDFLTADDIDISQLSRWIKESTTIQWDYKNVIKNKGILHKIGSHHDKTNELH